MSDGGGFLNVTADGRATFRNWSRKTVGWRLVRFMLGWLS